MQGLFVSKDAELARAYFEKALETVSKKLKRFLKFFINLELQFYFFKKTKKINSLLLL